MKRILVLLSVVALMVVMLAMSVAPAFAAWEVTGCRTGDNLEPISNGTNYYLKDKNGNTFVCATTVGGGSNEHVRLYDDRPVA